MTFLLIISKPFLISILAEVERNFDDIARGVKDWTEMLKVFYSKFHNTVEDVKEMLRENQENVYGKIQVLEE